MLIRKMLREFRMNFGQFFSVFLLAALAMALFCTFEGHVLSQKSAREAYHKECNLSDLWVYGEGFSEEELEAVRSLDFVEDAQLRMSIQASAPDFDGAQADLYLERENIVNTPYLIEGEPFSPEDTEGIWIANAFAERRGVQVGDDFTMEYNGIRFTRKVKGLIESAEYEFRQAQGDADMRLGEVRFTDDSIIITAQPVGEMRFDVVERVAPLRVVLQAAQSPVPLTLAVCLKPVGEDATEVTSEIDVEIPAMLKPLVGGKMQEAADKFGDLITTFFGGK